MVEETEVFRLDSKDFNKSKCYAFALRTRIAGSWPNEKYYTTNTLQYLGKHIRSEDWGSRDDHGGAETFDNNGIETRIVYDYEGLTCFKQVQCLDDIGMPAGGRKSNRKSKKSNRKNIKKSARKNNRNL
jgi:hypothetical protein